MADVLNEKKEAPDQPSQQNHFTPGQFTPTPIQVPDRIKPVAPTPLVQNFETKPKPPPAHNLPQKTLPGLSAPQLRPKPNNNNPVEDDDSPTRPLFEWEEWYLYSTLEKLAVDLPVLNRFKRRLAVREIKRHSKAPGTAPMDIDTWVANYHNQIPLKKQKVAEYWTRASVAAQISNLNIVSPTSEEKMEFGMAAPLTRLTKPKPPPQKQIASSPFDVKPPSKKTTSKKSTATPPMHPGFPMDPRYMIDPRMMNNPAMKPPTYPQGFSPPAGYPGFPPPYPGGHFPYLGHLQAMGMQQMPMGPVAGQIPPQGIANTPTQTVQSPQPASQQVPDTITQGETSQQPMSIETTPAAPTPLLTKPTESTADPFMPLQEKTLSSEKAPSKKISSKGPPPPKGTKKDQKQETPKTDQPALPSMQSDHNTTNLNAPAPFSVEAETTLAKTIQAKWTKEHIEQFFEINPTFRPTFRDTLLGRNENFYHTATIQSPYTMRILKPFIRRDTTRYTKKMLVLHELGQYHDFKRNGTIDPIRPMPSIDYCYLQPAYLNQVNQLLSNEFWPGIDVSESLIDPEHTVVVLLKRLVIACGFITINGYVTYICVHPDFRGLGIAKFMVYHLIQTCPDRDITLHVSASNSAMLLYNKFGFKIEEFIINFYDQYLPEGAEHSKNAYFLRLRR